MLIVRHAPFRPSHTFNLSSAGHLPRPPPSPSSSPASAVGLGAAPSTSRAHAAGSTAVLNRFLTLTDRISTWSPP